MRLAYRRSLIFIKISFLNELHGKKVIVKAPHLNFMPANSEWQIDRISANLYKENIMVYETNS